MIGSWHVLKISHGNIVSDFVVPCDSLSKKNLIYHKYAHYPWFILSWVPNCFIN